MAFWISIISLDFYMAYSLFSFGFKVKQTRYQTILELHEFFCHRLACTPTVGLAGRMYRWYSLSFEGSHEELRLKSRLISQVDIPWARPFQLTGTARFGPTRCCGLLNIIVYLTLCQDEISWSIQAHSGTNWACNETCGQLVPLLACLIRWRTYTHGSWKISTGPCTVSHALPKQVSPELHCVRAMRDGVEARMSQNL